MQQKQFQKGSLELYNPQETRKTLNRQPKFTLKTTEKRRRATTTKKISRRK